jgi:serine/threonine protein kinase
MIADQILCRLEFLHEMTFIHRDLKPENFVMGLGRRSHHVYMIDLGLAKRYCDPRTREHIPFIDGKALTGTARYVSINTHIGYQQSRRDDIESLGYILVYFAKGSLPWQGVRGANKQGRYEKIKESKIETPIEVLCEGLPPEFAEYLRYSRALAFEEAPDYALCRQLFERVMNRLGHVTDYKFQWVEAENDVDETLVELMQSISSGSVRAATHNSELGDAPSGAILGPSRSGMASPIQSGAYSQSRRTPVPSSGPLKNETCGEANRDERDVNVNLDQDFSLPP